MPRMTHGIFKNQGLPVTAQQVDELYHQKYKNHLDRFTCVSCGVKVQFNRGIGLNDPHFKNYPNVSHEPDCSKTLPDLDEHSSDGKNYGDIKHLKSFILPRANDPSFGKEKRIRSYEKRSEILSGPTVQKFIYSIFDLLDSRHHYCLREEYKGLELKTETGEYRRLDELIGTQDEIISLIDKKDSSICIVKGLIKNVIEKDAGIILHFSYKGSLGNSKAFRLFIPKVFISRNKKSLENIQGKVILAYGLAEKHEKYGYQMEIYNIRRQTVVLTDTKEKKSGGSISDVQH